MYPSQYNGQGSVQHKIDCGLDFRREAGAGSKASTATCGVIHGRGTQLQGYNASGCKEIPTENCKDGPKYYSKPPEDWYCDLPNNQGNCPQGITPSCDNNYVLSLGYLLLIPITIPLGFINLDDNMIVQQVKNTHKDPSLCVACIPEVNPCCSSLSDPLRSCPLWV